MKEHRCKITFLIGLIVFLAFLLGNLLQASGPPSIIDAHEHIESLAKAELLLKANQELNIKKTILLATPTETLTLNGHKSFTGYRENMDELLKIAEKYPHNFIPLCTISPLDSDAREYLQSCIEAGGKGLKLYNGHSYYYDVFGIPLDSPRMLPIYAYAERNKIPVLHHVNITKFGDELESVLTKYPDLVVSVPHFMVSSIGLDKVTALLDKYPNLYTDISFGSPEFMASGFRRISWNTKKYANFMNTYQDRVMFGADMVLTNAEHKDQDFMEEILTCYKELLEEKQFTCDPVKNYYEKALRDHEYRYEQCKPKEGDYCQSLEIKVKTSQKRFDQVISLNGLGLSAQVLEKIYWKNPNRFLRANN